MNKRNWRLAAIVLAAAACIIVIAVWQLGNRGAPAVEASSYLNKTEELQAGTELKPLTDASGGLPGMQLVADNAGLSLYYNPETTSIAVRHKAFDQVWHSNPVDLDEDGIASGFEKELLSSQMTLQFRDSVGTLSTYTNFAMSISTNQFVTESIPDGLRITYTIGDVSVGIDVLPKFISPTRMEEKILSQLDETTATYVSQRYYPKRDNPEVLERLDAQVSKPIVLNRMTAAFEQAGYTEEDLAFDNEENGLEGGALSTKPSFVVPIEYRLDGDSLLASIPVNQIQESGSFRIRSLSMLNFFGAAGMAAEGYIFVPDGSGSLIHLNNGKVREDSYVQKLYGTDPNDNSWRRGQVSQSARMPVFGMKADDAAWVAIIEEGDAAASIVADISGKTNAYNYAYSSFLLRGEDELELYTGTTVQEIQLQNDEIYKGDLQVRYSFLQGEQANYAGMAALYREGLTQQQVLKPLEASEAVPFYVDIIGSVDKRKTFLGVPYQSLVAMTTFDQAAAIAQQLQSDDITNVRMRYMGWFGEGMNHREPVHVKHDRVLGSKSELLGLADQLRSSGGQLYPDVAFQRVYQDKGGFTPSDDAARFVTREVAQLYPYNRALGRMDMTLGSYYLMSPAKLPHYVDTFVDRYGNLDIQGISLRDLGQLLSSDYRENRVVARSTAKEIVEEQLGKLDQAIPETMIAGGNAYAWAYADHLIDVPLASSGFVITDEDVPFYQMVVHGSIDYTGGSINLNDEQSARQQLLRSLEFGAMPRFTWSYEPSSMLKFTPYDTMFSTSYTDWYDEAVSMYNEVNEAHSQVRAEHIVDHIAHQDGVSEVRYSGGQRLIVNYTLQDVEVNGMVVQAEDYWMGGGQP